MQLSKELLIEVLTTADVGVWQWTKQTNKLVCSDTLKTQLGYDSDCDWQVLGDLKALIHKDDLPELEHKIASLLPGQISTLDCTLRMRCANGQWRWIRCRAKATFDDASNLQRLTASHVDFTELKLNEDRLYAIIEHSPVANVVVDRQGTIRLINRMAEQVFGYERCDLLGNSIELLLPARFRQLHQLHRNQYAQNASPRQMGIGRELFARHRNEVEFPVEIGLTPIQINGEGLIIATILDISERKLAELRLKQYAQRLEASNRDLEQFAYVASHDLQEPLRAVAGYCQLLEVEYSEQLSGEGREFIQHAVDGTVRMQSLIHGLLEFSRVNGERLPLELVELDHVVQSALQNLRPVIEETGAQIEVEPLPAIEGYASQLIQLFQNLIGNAIKFRRQDVPPCIHVSAVQVKTDLAISVTDNGIGIDPRYYERIFELFQRLHNRDRYEGAGIGLAVCKRIAERHGATIEISPVQGDAAQTSGTVFTLRFMDFPQSIRKTL